MDIEFRKSLRVFPRSGEIRMRDFWIASATEIGSDRFGFSSISLCMCVCVCVCVCDDIGETGLQTRADRACVLSVVLFAI